MKKFLSLILSISIFMLLMPYAIAEENYGENLCLGKSCTSNGYYGDPFKPENAVDGNYNTTAACGSIDRKPIEGMGSYYAVDLGAEYMINRIIVRTRRDVDAIWARVIDSVGIANKENLSDYVKLGEKKVGGEFGSNLNVVLEKPLKARYIVAIASSLGEIEAYGVEAAESAEGEFGDVTDAKQKNAVKIVTTLGVMEPVGADEFGAINLMTRAEAASIALKIYGAEPGTYRNEFSDVTEDTQYAADISAALQSGIVSKDDKFRPDDYVTAAEFYAMLLRINGYITDYTDVDWPDTVIKLAQQSGLSKGVGAISDTVSRGIAAQIIYNMMTSKYMEFKMQTDGYMYSESENTFMHEKYKVDMLEGIVTADEATSLESEDGKTVGKIVIGGESYNYEANGSSLIGKAVYYLVNYEDNELIAVWVNEKKTNTEELFAEDISETSKTEIYADDGSGKDKKYRISKDAYFLKNGVAFADITYNEMTPKYGSIVLTDYDNDGIYDVVELREPEIVTISAATHNEERNEIILSGKGYYKKTINYDTVKVSKNGKTGKISDLKSGYLAYVYLSESGKHVEFELSSASVSGVVTSMNNDTVTLDGKSYELSEYFIDKFKNDLTIDKEYTFLLNTRNQIVYTTQSDELSNTEQLAFIRKCYVDEEDETIVFDVYTENSKFVKLSTTTGFKLDGEKLSVNGFNALGKSHFIGHPVIIKTNSQGELIRMTTDSSEKLIARNIDIVGAKVGTAGFYNGHQLVLPKCHDTVIFSVPTNSQGVPQTDADFDSMYSVTTINRMYPNNREDITSSKKCYFYGSDENDLPIAGIVKTVYNDSVKYSPILKYDSRLSMVVSEVSLGVDSNDEPLFNIEGYDLSTGTKRTITTQAGLTDAVNSFKIHNVDLYNDVPDDKKPKSDWMRATKMLYLDKLNEYFITPIEDIKKNDIIRYASSDGQSTVSELEVVMEYEKLKDCTNKVLYSVGDLPDSIFSTFRLEKVRIDACGDGRIKFYTNDVEEDLSLSDFRGKLIISNNAIDTYLMSTAEGYIGSGECAIVFSSAADHYSIIVYK